MEFKCFVRFFIVIFVVSFGLSEARIFYVGGRNGWALYPPENYNHWAERNRFQINDTLYFKYEKNTDSILIVTEKNYKNCNITAPLQALTNGDSEFKFGRSGPFFFISGNADHCYKGQKLIVVVLAIRKHRAPPAAPIPFPTPATPTPSPESKPPTPVSKAPKPSSSAPEPPTNEPSMNPSNVDAPATAPHASYAAKFGCSVGLVLGVIIGTTMFLSSFVELM